MSLRLPLLLPLALRVKLPDHHVALAPSSSRLSSSDKTTCKQVNAGAEHGSGGSICP